MKRNDIVEDHKNKKDEEVTENYENFMKRKHIVEDHKNKITLQRRKTVKREGK